MSVTTTLFGTFSVAGSASITDTSRAIYSPAAAVQVGSGGFPALSINFADGTGNQQAKYLYCEQLSVPSGGTVQLNLNGSTLVNGLNVALNFAAVKLALVALNAPDGATQIWVGPQGVGGAAQLWFGGVGPTVYEVVWDHVYRVHSWAGWGVSVGNGILPIFNPTAAAAAVNVLLVGI